MKLMIVDDHEVVREGLIATLADVRHVRIIGAVGTGKAALTLASRVMPDVALVDLRLPDTTGDDLCRELHAVSRCIAVVILSSYLNEETVRKSLGAGAVAYLTKSAGLPRLREVLEQIRADPSRRASLHTAPQVVKQLDELESAREGVLKITTRQEQIVWFLAEGLTNAAIAERLFISESTVRFHIQRAKTRLEARTRAELVAKAMRVGAIAPAPDDVGAPYSG
jgi:DNA-binding NarL/FixJ family response regulator